MRNPLIDSCLELSRAGYEGRENIFLDYYNPKLFQLGNFLLNRSGLNQEFRLRGPKLGYRQKERRGDVAIMFGGGIDSYCAFIKALKDGRNIYLIHVLYGAPYSLYERRVFKSLQDAWRRAFTKEATQGIPNHANPFTDDLRVQLEGVSGLRRDALMMVQHEVAIIPSNALIDLSWENYIVPARNLVFAAIGSQYAPDIWIVSNKRKDEEIGTPDKTSSFYRGASDLFTDFYGYPVRVSSPFSNMSKQEMVEKYLEAGGSAQALRSTISCYSPVVEKHVKTGKDKKVLHCGRCYACYKRHKLFTNLREEHEFYFDPMEAENRGEYQAREKAKGRDDGK